MVQDLQLMCDAGNVDSCSVEIDTTMTTGRTESFSFGINYEIISASTSITFEQSKSRTVSYTYMQPGGTRGECKSWLCLAL